MNWDVPVEERDMESYLQEAQAMIGRFGSMWMLKNEDIIANVASAIAKAEHNFDPSRGVKRVTVRITYGRNQIIKEVRRIKRLINRPHHFSINADGIDSEGSSYSSDFGHVEDYRQPEVPEIERKENDRSKTKYIRDIINDNKSMTSKQKKYLRMRYITGLSVVDIAERQGCSKQAVSQVLLAGIKSLKRDLL